ncbi:MAG: HNH endonuclease [Phycisphaerae bacterium]|nr:HNH endonuclease [Phycisphaerae bacterium]
MKTIQLTQGKTSIISNSDFGKVSKLKWQYCLVGRKGHKRECVMWRGKIDRQKVTIIMSRLIMDCPPSKEVDHRNGNRLDNRRCNLRVCSHAENMRNQKKKVGKNIHSKYKGVALVQDKYWMSVLTYNYKTVYLGYHKTEKEAALVYDKKAKELFGEYANLNFN